MFRDVEMDGEWEAPLVENAKCKGVGCGKWTAALIDNPKCKSGGCGPWSAPMIENPDFKVGGNDFFQGKFPVRRHIAYNFPMPWHFGHFDCISVCCNPVVSVYLQGKWSPRKIANPDYFEDKSPFKMTPIVCRISMAAFWREELF